MKRIFATLLIFVLMASLFVGCKKEADKEVVADTTEKATDTNNATEAKEEPATDDVITLSVLAGQSTTDVGIEDMIDAALAKKYPNIKLEWETIGWGDGFQPKMQQYMQTELPDIIIGKAQDVATYSALGVLGDMTGKPYVDNVLAEALPGVTFDGKVYGLVYNALYQGVYYNKQIFADNNLSIPTTQEEMNQLITKLKQLKITPFATHFVDGWSIGNITMQFAINDVFNKTPDWGDQLRSGAVSYAASPEFAACYNYNKLIYDNTWKDETFSLQQTDCDARLVQGQAAMKVSGSWSIQNFIDIDSEFQFGIFPFPNQTGDSKLIFEPNITLMKSAASDQQDAIDKVFEVITGDKELALEIFNFTKTASMIKGVSPTFTNPSQADIDIYSGKGMIVDANTGNNQLKWGGFQEENAKDIASWLLGDTTIEDALKAADDRKDNSK